MAKSLLLADDSITIQKVVQITFASEDFQITSVDNGDAALDKIKAAKPHIVLADVVMPGKNGYDLCQTIKADAGLKGVPVILLAGTFEPFDPERAKAVGADDYIVKPFETQALIDKVKRLVGMEAGAANTAMPTPKPQQTGGFAPPTNPLFGAKAQAPATMTPMTTPPPQQPAQPQQPAKPASPFSGAGPLPAFGQQQKPPAQTPPVPAKDPFGMGPMFGGNQPAAKPVQPATPPPPAQPAQPAGQKWDMNSFDEIPTDTGGMPDIDMVEVEPVEQKQPVAAKPIAPPQPMQPMQPMPPAQSMAQGVAPKVAAAVSGAVTNAVSGSLEAQLKGPLSDAVREVIEKIVWEVVPDLAETIIREELERLLREKA